MDKSWKVILAFAGIFGAGVVSGIWVAPRVFDKVVEQSFQKGPGCPPVPLGQLGPQLFRRLLDQLSLTPDQEEKIKAVELRLTEELRTIRSESQQATEAAIGRIHGEVSALLTPEQRTQFEDRMAKGRARMEERMKEQEGRGGRRGGPPSNRFRDGNREVPPPPK